eukprot:XP_016655861.1 PREDICTED: probable multidrug resistance-associated protein lethal(2)03659 isoform X2 [Acyrthosiphon pisum]
MGSCNKCFSLCYSWLLSLFKTGQKRDLESNDLYDSLNDHKSSLLGLEIEKRWKIEIANAKSTKRKPSLLRVLVRMFGGSFLYYGLVQMFIEAILRMTQPLLIGGLLAYFNPGGSKTINTKHAYMYAFGLLLNILAYTVLFHYSQLEMLHIGMKIRVACCSTIYKKALTLSTTSLCETTVGQVVNLISNDVNRFDMALRCIQFLLIGPLQTIIVTYFLWQEIGVSSIIGVTVFLAFVPLQGWLGKITSDYRSKIAPRTDERVRIMNEIISGIQVIKMYTWEKPFALLVQYARKMEIEQIRGTSWIRVFFQSFRIFHIRFALFTSILSYVLLGNYINTQQVFVIISYFNILRITMTVLFPEGVLILGEMLISIKRIQSFLLQDEKDKPNKQLLLKSETTSINGAEMSNINNKNCIENTTENEGGIDKLGNFGIDILNASAKWILNQPDKSLNNINLTVRPGRLVAIIGPVGAGKSSLIHAILRELPLCEGSISVHGTVSYACQEPWLFNGSVQQNILFGSPMDHDRYKEVIKVCALKTDFKQLPYGDRSLVGERGVSLSGGQRARVNLARAVYKQADIYLLDDPLSAVDTHVGKHLFEKCIKGYLKNKTCILITHQIQYLSSVDQIVLMENANILAEGSYQELQSSGLDFTKLLRSSEETTTDSEINIKNATSNSLEQHSELSRQGSIKSVASSVDEDTLNGAQTELTEAAETRSSRNVSRTVYLSYISAGGNIFKISFLLFLCIFTQVLATGVDYWISYWVYLEDHVFPNAESNSMNINYITYLLFDTTSIISRQFCVIMYAILNLTLLIVIFIRCAMFVSVIMDSSMNLHNNMFNAITRATMYFFNTNSSGRILNRFTKDVGAIDEILPLPLLDFVTIALQLIGTLVVVGIINIYLLIPTFIIGLICYYTVIFYLSTSRSIKRLEGVTRSPVYGYLNASLQGLSTIRAFKAEDILCKEFDEHQDLHSSTWYLFISTSEAFGFSLDMVSLMYLCILTFSFLLVNNDIFGGDVGLVLTQLISMTGSLQWGIRRLAELDNQMSSVERVLEYTNVPQEAPLESSPDKKPPREWPDKGQIVFENFYLRYSLDGDHVLKNLNILIQPMEKVGIVGRTGAGKSSIIGALFRLALNEGNITIDGIEIHELGLHDLRSKISIIPQEPVLFSGSMRKNLDPLDEYSDHALWNALEEVQLKTVVEDLPDGLNSKMSEGGSNFSVGQRQLVCLARAIVRSNKILVLDEATANVDSQTDALIQNTIRNKFRSCTVLTIAHRLNTVMDSDRVLVMDAGTIVEFDYPYNLLKNKDGFLYKMVEQTGSESSDLLHSIAAESFNTTKNQQ